MIFPETYLKESDLKLTSEYFLVETNLSVKDIDGLHEVAIKINGVTSLSANLYLEKFLDEKKIRFHERLKIYRPNIPEALSPALNSRNVLFQRFRDRK